jgi:predicted MFS family arabinose efflux permease
VAQLTRTRAPAAFLVVGGSWLATMAGANLATPLYAVYEHRFGFSHAALTLVFATYALVLAAALLIFGQLSDRLGRRRVMVAGLLTAASGLALFAIADGIAWLFAARAVQGLAVGMLGGAASAALVELDPRPEEHLAALVAALAQAGGSGAGPILAGMLAEWAPAPRVLCYVLVLAVTLAGAVAVLRIPEPGTVTAGRWRIQRPHVPAPMRVAFARWSITSAAVWAICALFLSVVPSYAAELLDTDDLALLGSVAGLILASSCVAQLAARRVHAFARAQAAGLGLAAAGLVALVAAFPLHSLACLIAAALLAGAGHGIAFLGAQSELNLAAPTASRGEVNAAFYTCTYLGVAIAVIGTGLLTLTVALSTAVTLFACAIGAICLVTAWWHLSGAGHRSGSARSLDGV